MNIKVEISYGEFLDKLSILEIKSERIHDAGKLENVNHELKLLRKLWAEDPKSSVDIQAEMAEMKRINETLWKIEDDIRDRERARDFGEEFVRLARAVYYINDERADVKRRLNKKLGSELVEEKSYADYQ
ncbi:hypothetical protein MNBD_GAMMA25-665 [hydrothermal vent metagenome]|uniref:Uncharacterized protein n=1 Tax=hydrothermal vent metagenome TaxID=652676 RepID=A0A3B1BFN7_9ZZZZ